MNFMNPVIPKLSPRKRKYPSGDQQKEQENKPMQKRKISDYILKNQITLSSTSYFKFGDQAQKIDSLLNKDQMESILETSHVNRFVSNLRNYVLKLPFDVCVVLDDKHMINAHKIILVNSSEYFRQKLENCEEVNVVKVDGHVNIDSMKICLDYMYCGGVNIDLNLTSYDLMNLRNCAKLLELDDFIKVIDHYIQLKTKEEEKKISDMFLKENLEMKTQQILLSYALNPFNFYAENLKKLSILFDSSLLDCTNNPLLNLNKNTNVTESKDSMTEMNSQVDDIDDKSSTKSSTDNEPVFIEPSETLSDSNIHIKIKKHIDSIFHNYLDYEDKKRLTSNTFPQSLCCNMEIDTISREFLIKNKYIYPSMIRQGLENEKSMHQFLKSVFENFSYVNLEPALSDNPNRMKIKDERKFCDSFVIFSLVVGKNNQMRMNNFVMSAVLDFSDMDVLKQDIKQRLESFLNSNLLKQLKVNTLGIQKKLFSVDISRVCYLKKPANSKAIKMETIYSTMDCIKATVEYSQALENELPFVLCTINASVVLI